MRIREHIYENRHLPVGELMNTMLNRVREFDPTNPPADDTTVIALKMSNGTA